MDIRNEKNHIFNIRLAKLGGLYQMLDPRTSRFRGQNVYRIVTASFVSYLCAVATVVLVSSVYYCKYNTPISILYFWISSSSLYVCYKMYTVLYHADDIWNCLSITRYGFTSPSTRNGRDHILGSWRERSVLYTSLLAVMYSMSVPLYVGFPLALGDGTMPIKNRDGSVGDYRQNVIGLYIFASDQTYNEYYNAFFAAETLFVAGITFYFTVFDVLLLSLSFAICCQMQIVRTAFESVNHKTTPLSGRHSSSIGEYTDEKQNTSKEHNLIYDELKTIIIDHQAVIKHYELFLKVFGRVMLLHIFISSISLIIIWFNFIMSFTDGGAFVISRSTTVKITLAIPAFSFQIFMTCYLFENLHNQKDSIIFALYSSNWTEMDMKCKKLILLTMKMNNANQKKLKFTTTRIVNLEMFFNTMRDCYSVVSVLLNYIKTKLD